MPYERLLATQRSQEVVHAPHTTNATPSATALHKEKLSASPKNEITALATKHTESIAPSATNEREVSSAAQAAKEAGHYTLVLASSITLSNAKVFVAQLHKAGVADAEVYRHRRMVRVVSGSYDTENEAQTALRKLRTKDACRDAWIMKR